MRYLILIILLTGCGETRSPAQIEHYDMTNDMRIKAWQACIDSGGAPIEAWIGAPSMQRCDYRAEMEKGNE